MRVSRGGAFLGAGLMGTVFTVAVLAGPGSGWPTAREVATTMQRRLKDMDSHRVTDELLFFPLGDAIIMPPPGGSRRKNILSF